MATLSYEQRLALRDVEITVTGREIVDKWRRAEGWETLMAILSQCGRLNIKVKIHEGDWQIGNRIGEMQGWVLHGGGDMIPGLPSSMTAEDVMTVNDRGMGGWVQRLMDSAVKGKPVKIEYDWI